MSEKIKVPMEYKVLYEDSNAKSIEWLNVFNHSRFCSQLMDLLGKNKTQGDFKTELRDICSYNFWSKCEYEVIVSCWPPYERGAREKIDIYDQLMANFTLFADYIWQHKDNLFMENRGLYYEE